MPFLLCNILRPVHWILWQIVPYFVFRAITFV